MDCPDFDTINPVFAGAIRCESDHNPPLDKSLGYFTVPVEQTTAFPIDHRERETAWELSMHDRKI
jgi:hypothetical protein